MSYSRIALLTLIISALSACSSTPEPARRYSPALSTSAPQNVSHLIASSSSHQKVGNPYVVAGRRYEPRRDDQYDQVGIGSWYGPTFHGRDTANGEIFDQNAMTAAHTTLPIPSIVEVTNLDNGRSIILRLNDRGPFVDDRIIDLSRAAATELGYQRLGLAPVRVRYLGPAQPHAAPPASSSYMASANSLPAPAPMPMPLPMTPPTVLPTPPSTEWASLPTTDPDPLDANLPALPPQTDMPAPSPGLDMDTGNLAPVEPSLTLQLAAFSDRLNANAFTRRLSDAGDVWVEAGTSNGFPVYRVFFGRWQDEASARSAQSLIENWGVFDARIVGLN